MSSRSLRCDGPEPHYRKPEEEAANSRHRQEFGPHYVETRAVVEDRLRERHEMGRGRTCIAVASQAGMLSSGVLLPESMFMGRKTNMKRRPSRGIECATVPRKMPIAVAKNR